MQANHEKISELIHKTYDQYKIYNGNLELKLTGFGKILDSQKFFWIRMPKCANTFVSHHVNNMREIDYNHDYLKINSSDYTGFVILRDPMERWISGAISFIKNDNESRNFDYYDSINFLQDLLKYKNYFTSTIIEYIIEKLSRDYHGLPQAWRLYPCNPNNIDFFFINDKLGYQLNHYFRSFDLVTTINNQKINVTADDLMMKFLREFIFDYANQKYKEKIMEILKPDYELISLVNFYNK